MESDTESKLSRMPVLFCLTVPSRVPSTENFLRWYVVYHVVAWYTTRLTHSSGRQEVNRLWHLLLTKIRRARVDQKKVLMKHPRHKKLGLHLPCVLPNDEGWELRRKHKGLSHKIFSALLKHTMDRGTSLPGNRKDEARRLEYFFL